MLGMENFNIREAKPSDASLLVSLIRELAEFEKLAHEAVATPELLSNALENGDARALVVEQGDRALGFALYFFNFSTFLGRPGLYLEDLYVKPECRGAGVGEALLRKLAQIAREKKCGRMEWAVLDWNTKAISFYQKLGAKPMNEWTVYRLDSLAIDRLAGQ